MSEKTITMGFTVDPIFLTKHLLQMYIEKHIEGKTTLSRQYALYEYVLNTASDDQVQNILDEYATRYQLEVITFENYEYDCRAMIEIIEELEEFQLIVRKFDEMNLKN